MKDLFGNDVSSVPRAARRLKATACRKCGRSHNQRGLVCTRCRYKTRDKEKDNATQRTRRRSLTGEKRARHLASKRRWHERRKERNAPAVAERKRLRMERKQQRVAEQQARKVKRELERAEKLKACPWLDPKLSGAERWALRYANDPVFNMQERFRAAARRGKFGVWVRLGCRLRDAMVRGREVPRAYRPLIDYTAQQLRDHLQRQFTKGMTWELFCAGDIHIDHRIPLSMFDLSDEGEARRAWALSNLSPLWSSDNLSKNAKRLTLL